MYLFLRKARYKSHRFIFLVSLQFAVPTKKPFHRLMSNLSGFIVVSFMALSPGIFFWLLVHC